MSGAGRCYDNARMESFFAMLKKERLYQLDTLKMKLADVKTVVYRFICYYNLRRIYTANGRYPPLTYRERYYSSKNGSFYGSKQPHRCTLCSRGC